MLNPHFSHSSHGLFNEKNYPFTGKSNPFKYSVANYCHKYVFPLLRTAIHIFLVNVERAH